MSLLVNEAIMYICIFRFESDDKDTKILIRNMKEILTKHEERELFNVSEHVAEKVVQ